MGNIQECCAPRGDPNAKCLWDQDTVDTKSFSTFTVNLLKKDLLIYIETKEGFYEFVASCKKTKYEIPILFRKLKRADIRLIFPDFIYDKALSSKQIKEFQKQKENSLHTTLDNYKDFVTRKREEFEAKPEEVKAKIEAMNDEVDLAEAFLEKILEIGVVNLE